MLHTMDPFIGVSAVILFCCLVAGVTGETAVPCTERLNAKEAGYITTPGYPHDYPAHQKCEWVIYSTEPNQRIVLNFNPHFELEKHECRYDFVEIRDGDNEFADLLGKHCGNIAPPTIISSGPALYIRFVSDYAHQGAGFSLRYEIHKTGSDDCSKNFTALSGMIQSPGFPDKYPHNLDCAFIIVAQPRTEVTLHFFTFDLENDPLRMGEGDCKYDWLEIWDGLPQVGPLIGRYCGTQNPSQIHSTTGVLSLTFHTDMAVAKDGFSAYYSVTPREVPETFQCSMPLGMESGKITNEQISSSSTYSDMRWTPQQGRLNSGDNGWTPNDDNNKEYIQVDLRFLKVLTAIATQGAISKETQNSYYVTSYKLEVSTNGEDWMMYRHGKNHKIFLANNDATEVVLNKIPQPLLARFIRIRPQTWKYGIALRFELYGCQVTDAPCSDMLGMLSGLIPDSQISASSTREYHWALGVARLVASRTGWFPRPPQPQAGEEWLQVDLGIPKKVTGLIIQGARGGEGSSSSEIRAFVRRFKVAHSMNGENWEFLKDPKTALPKLFEGNVHYDTPEIQRFDPVPAQYVRVYPERWSPTGLGMRLEILGCDWMEMTPTTETFKPTMQNETTTEALYGEDSTNYLKPSKEPTDLLPKAPFSEFNCSFDRHEDNHLCGWTLDHKADFNWVLHSRGTQLSRDYNPANGSYLYMETNEKRERMRARILSPIIQSMQGPFCMVFRYHMHGTSVGSLRVSLLTENQKEVLLWAMSETQGNDWKEGRIVLPTSSTNYQVVFEGVVGNGYKGDIAIDDIYIANKLPYDQCTEFSTASTDKSSETSDASTPKEMSNFDLSLSTTPSPASTKEKSWLYSLDPILVTIIAMSSLGVLLGAICAGLLLYCTCSYTGISSRSSTTLENYNFELYDGIKNKVKMNQKCCSEA
ncbi:neuropilin-2 isoform X1 [Latimeria chalumnae]|uniref:neuropilin-2 isoform X1 n=1 Tax=Latimeria chalumnae TaxID=7897 RepID=UPI0003C17630|nr:PREDICTED: neuropilin-2 isoform X1 [Latimeria chalumnae]|eukprot:XP_005998455.1 PREDICTED: neuropilin-2 isoform X1 [Latimeria chalumnae]